jgi:hypothetical protein
LVETEPIIQDFMFGLLGTIQLLGKRLIASQRRIGMAGGFG